MRVLTRIEHRSRSVVIICNNRARTSQTLRQEVNCVRTQVDNWEFRQVVWGRVKRSSCRNRAVTSKGYDAIGIGTHYGWLVLLHTLYILYGKIMPFDHTTVPTAHFTRIYA